MADPYIDYLEVGEYGDHFVEQSKKLIGASKLVDIDELRKQIGAAVAKVDAELEKAGVKRSSLRGGKQETDAKTAAARKEIERFWSYLGSLDDDIAFDLGAFFDGKKLGALAALKPADVKAKADSVLRGFQAKLNLSLPDRAKWEAKLVKIRDDLASALTDKGSAANISITSTAGLTAAREEFLTLYNGVAKRLVQGILIALGRKDEYEMFFKDLQVNERGAPAPKGTGKTSPSEPPAAETDDGAP